jgi:hypothetical protein
MGCDIHFFAEHRKDADSPWEFLPAPPHEAPYRYGACDTSQSGYQPGYDNRYSDPGWRGSMRDWFDDRNYDLFGALADVRTRELDPILPETRGWPVDCCHEIRGEEENIEHTPNWLTVREMLDYFGRLRPDVREAHASRFEECLREMLAASGREPENVRAVFYFDS